MTSVAQCLADFHPYHSVHLAQTESKFVSVDSQQDKEHEESTVQSEQLTRNDNNEPDSTLNNRRANE